MFTGAHKFTIRSRVMIAIVIVINSFVPVQAVTPAYALVESPGTIDTTFDTDGKVTTGFNDSGSGWSVITQPDGKILVVGHTFNDPDNDFALSRYNSNGSPDTTFDSDGKVTTNFVVVPFGGSDDVAYDGAIQSDGKIVVVGDTSGGFGYDQSFAVARYNTNGSLDSSFDDDGRVTTDFGNDNYGRSVAIQPDGKIVVAGITSSGSTSYFALARYNTNGSLDATFGVGGKLVTDFNGLGVYGGEILLQPDGKILLAGSQRNIANEDDFGLARFNTDGTPDLTFGGGGKVITNILGEDDFGDAVALQPDGKIVLAGSSYENGVSYAVMARYQSDGELDTTFSTDGKVISAFGGGGMEATSVLIQSNGRIVLGGYVWGEDTLGGNFALERYNRDGSLDTTFGTGGRATVDFGANDQAASVALQRDGKILLTGRSIGSDFPVLALARFTGDETLTVTKTANTNDGVCNSDCSLREAIATASSGSTINFMPSLSGGTITLSSTLLIEKDLTIDGAGLASRISISGNNNVTVMEITPGTTAMLNNLTIKNGNSEGTGGIFSEGVLYITNSAIKNNTGASGGGIHNNNVMDIINSTVSGNTSTADGAGIYTANGTLNVTNTIVSNNSAGGGGGGIYNALQGILHILDSSVSSNSTLQAGGGIDSQGVLEITSSEIVENTAVLNGGGVLSFGPMNISESVISDNIGESGGGIINYGASTIVDSLIANNSATEGGGIVNPGTLDITGSVITGNTATYGGGIASSYSVLNINASTLSDNSALEAGGGIMTQGAAINITNSTFAGNSAVGGGAVYSSYDAELDVVNSTFANNSAEVGGGVFNNSAILNLTNNTFSHNSAGTGGGIYNAGTLNYINTILANSISGGDCYNESATSGDVGTNIKNLVETNAAAPNQCGTPAITADPKLGSLASNHGLTHTFALLSGSPAINAGNDASCPAFDQRWIERPQGSHCDIGAYETEGSIATSIGPYGLYYYPLGPGESKRVSHPNINSGPVNITDMEGGALLAAERVLYRSNGVDTSFSEMMALPASQVDTTYWLPWYNSKTLDTQLRIANVSDMYASVHVTIGGVEMTGSPFMVSPGESQRLNFANIDKGPVMIESDQEIIAAERVFYKVNGVNTSFSEMMALPASQVDTTYWLPWYNSKTLDTQLRIANVTNTEANVHVTIGGVEVTGSPFTIPAGASIRKTFPNIDKGPVMIESDQDIVAAERVIYKVKGVNTSFTEMMALPAGQVDTTYWLPWYNSKNLDTQLRIANVSNVDANVNVTIGGVEVTGSPFTVPAGGSVRKTFPNIDKGPIKIVSDQDIVSAERVIYKVNGVNTSFSEMMGLPNGLLDSTYWLPWYNNKTLDTQLRFGLP